MFEHVKNDILPFNRFLFRLFKFYCLACALLLFGILPGVIGFMVLDDLPLFQSFMNAISLLGSIELPHPPQTAHSHVFTALYSLFIETVFLLAVATLLAPVVHRIFHKMHLQTD
ncbi:hypothetical protein [Photobacterium sp. GSS17]|uniref:hypothetical protein n=1 Tax=Photobacterium sp. GSS17 TaxID=3020715 RepID=UPI00236174A5|nr:hypothetical protein [Photobacterium sp. GSS17]